MSSKKSEPLKRYPKINPASYWQDPCPPALALALWGTTEDEAEDLDFWLEHRDRDNEEMAQAAWIRFADLQDRVLNALGDLDADFFERFARVIRAVKKARNHDFHNKVAAILIATYGSAGIEGRLGEMRRNGQLRLPHWSEHLNACKQEKAWPKFGKEQEEQEASHDKYAENVARYQLKLDYAPAKRGPKPNREPAKRGRKPKRKR